METDPLKAWYAHTDECAVCHVAMVNLAYAHDRDSYCDEGVRLALKALAAYMRKNGWCSAN